MKRSIKNIFHDSLWCILLYHHMIWVKECQSYLLKVMAATFHDMMHKLMDTYIDDTLIKSKEMIITLIFSLMCLIDCHFSYKLRLNHQKCISGIESSKILGFMITKWEQSLSFKCQNNNLHATT